MLFERDQEVGELWEPCEVSAAQQPGTWHDGAASQLVGRPTSECQHARTHVLTDVDPHEFQQAQHKKNSRQNNSVYLDADLAQKHPWRTVFIPIDYC